MAQHDYNIANATFPATRSDINSVLSAINTSNSGTSRPSSAVEGTVWLDTTNATTPTLKFYDGADDISLAILDYTANTVNWIDSTVVFDIVNDLSPELGGNLNLNSNDITGTGDVNITGSVTATSFSGDGSSLTGIDTGISWQSSIKTSNFTASANEGYWIDTTSNEVTVTFPASASVGDTIELVDYARNWGTNKIIIDSNGLNYQGEDDTYTVEYNTNGQALRIVYSGATKGWIPTSDDDVTNVPVPPPYNVDFLVIAGGGSGGAEQGSGGGAGGYRASYNSETSGGGGSSESAVALDIGTTYTITVGAGGSAVTGTPDANGNSGSDSVFATITSTGGGRGAFYDNNGGSGGSGGGGGGFLTTTNIGGSGTSGQGFDGGDSTASGSASNRPSGGGGGAGAIGQDGNVGTSTSGAGGNGVASTITGSSVTRAGGGGGGIDSNGTSGGAGGSGGGGRGSNPAETTAVSGSVNTGGGGGGVGQGDGTSGAGGSGIVILRMLTADYSGTTTGSPTVTTSGSDTILTFTGSGSYTA